MNVKVIPSKNYFCCIQLATLNTLYEVVSKELDPFVLFANKHKVKIAGPMEFIYFDCTNDRDKIFTVVFAYPVSETQKIPDSPYFFRTFDEFKCFAHTHQGSVEELFNVYDHLYQLVLSGNLQPTNQVREVYARFTELTAADNLTEIEIGLR